MAYRQLHEIRKLNCISQAHLPVQSRLKCLYNLIFNHATRYITLLAKATFLLHGEGLTLKKNGVPAWHTPPPDMAHSLFANRRKPCYTIPKKMSSVTIRRYNQRKNKETKIMTPHVGEADTRFRTDSSFLVFTVNSNHEGQKNVNGLTINKTSQCFTTFH